jgi:hypothetical protein
VLLIDYNQIFLANIFSQGATDNINENLIRHTILSSTLYYKKTFGSKYGNVVFCGDGQGSCWRKTIYPFYKANRRKSRDKSELNWHVIFESLNKIRDEILEYLPYKVVVINNTEADDTIATLVKKYHKQEPTMILSGDHDFIQLHRYTNVIQYSPIQKRYVTHNDPDLYLREKILRGDPGDGVPNFLSDDDCFVSPDKRQKPLRSKILQEYLNKPLSDFDSKLLQNYNRNEKVIDLIRFIPFDIECQIITEFENQKPSRGKMMGYFMQNGLKILMENLSEF